MRRRIAGVILLGGLLGVVCLLFFPVCAHVKSGPADKLMTRMHSLYIATKLYQEDDGVYPDMGSSSAFKRALSPYIKDESIFINPHDRSPILCNPSLSGKKPDKLWAPPEQIVLLYGRAGRDDRPFAAVNLDGTTRPYTLSAWAEVKRASRIP